MEREPDLIFEAVCEVCGYDWRNAETFTTNERGRVNVAVGEFRRLYAEAESVVPMLIHERATAYRQVYPAMPLTPQSLMAHWSSILAEAERQQEQEKAKATEQRQLTNAHARRGCQVCGDDHFVTVGYDANGYEQVAPCPECGPTDPSYWVQRRRVQVMDADTTKEMMDG
jgi:rubrerythrin